MNPENIRFASNLIPLILSGEKVLTYRKDDKYTFLEVGDEIEFVNSGTGETVGKLRIVEKSYERFKDLPFARDGHEKYDSAEHKRKVFEGYYGEIDDEENMLVLRFELVKKY